eukprot:CFRG7172T1
MLNGCVRSLPTGTFVRRSMATVTTKLPNHTSVEKDAYVHVRDSGEICLSYLSDDAAVKGPTLIGWLKKGTEVTPQNFEDNREFIKFYQEVVSDSILNCPDTQYLAGIYKEGFMHIHDCRNPPYQNRIPEHEDIVGSVRVHRGEMVPGTYEPMPVHRVVSAKGLMQLNTFLHQKLLDTYSRIQ